MTTWARIINGQAVDVVTTDPSSLFHPDLASEFVTVPDGTENGATFANGTWTAPVPPVEAPVPPAPYVPKIVSIGIFMTSIMTAERIALRASTDPLVKEFVTTVTDPKMDAVDLNLPSIQFDIQYAAGLVEAPSGAPGAGSKISSPCIGLNGDGAARAAAILAGNPLAASN